MFPLINHVSSILPSLRKGVYDLSSVEGTHSSPLNLSQPDPSVEERGMLLVIVENIAPSHFCSLESTDQPAKPALEAASGVRHAWFHVQRCCGSDAG